MLLEQQGPRNDELHQEPPQRGRAREKVKEKETEARTQTFHHQNFLITHFFILQQPSVSSNR